MAKETDGLPKNVVKQGAKADEVQKVMIAGEKTEKTPEELEKEKQEEAQALANQTPGEKGKSEGEDFEQKYNVLRGKYDNENAQLRETVRQQSESVETLTRALDSAQQAKDGAEGGDGEKESKPLPKEDFDGYGEEMVGMVNTVNKLMAENKKLKEDFGIIQGNVMNVQDNVAQSSANTLLSDLDKAIPNWEIINKDPAFLNWLGQVDPLTGIRRQSLLDDAYAVHDSQRVANFFVTYQGNNGKPAQNNNTQTEKANQLQEQVIPDGAGSAEVGQPAKPKITQAQFTKAVKDAQTGRITTEEFDKIANTYQLQFKTGA